MRGRRVRLGALLWTVGLGCALACTGTVPEGIGGNDGGPYTERLSPLHRTTVEAGIADGGVDSTGFAFAALRYVDRVLRFPPDGSPPDTIGRQGDGPCEYRRLIHVEPLDSVRVVVMDGRVGMVQTCGLDGVLQVDQVPGRALSGGRSGDGSVWIVSLFGRNALASLLVHDNIRGQQFTSVDTLALWDLDTIATRLGQPGTPSLVHLVWAGDRLFTANTSDTDFRILLVDPDGMVDTIADLDVPPVEYSSEELALRAQRVERLIRQSGRPVPSRAQLFGEGQSTTAPRFSRRALATGDGRTLWSRPAAPSDSLVDLFLFDIDSINRFQIAKVLAPVSDIAVAGRFLATFGENDDGTGVIAVYQVPESLGWH